LKIEKRWLKVTASAVAVVMIAVGAWLIVDYIASIPPDPQQDEAGRVVNYFFSDHFDGLTDQEQQAYIESMVRRYGSMDEQQRQAVEGAVKARKDADPESMRERMIQMWKGYVVSEAERYVAIPPPQRSAWLEQRIKGWQSMFGGSQNDGRDRGHGRDRMNEPLTPQRQQEIISFMQNEVMPRTSARDRALVSVLVRDIVKQTR